MNINYSLFNEVVKNKNFNVYKPDVQVILGSVIKIDGIDTPINKDMSVSYLTFYFYLVQLCNAGILNSDKYIQTLIFWKSLWEELSFFNNTNKNNSVKINSSTVDEVKINQLNKSSSTNRFYEIRDNIYVYCENKNILFAVKTTNDFNLFLEKQIRKIIYQFDKKINGAVANANTNKKIKNFMEESPYENVFELMKNPVIIGSQFITLRWKYTNYNSNIKFIFTINPVLKNLVLYTPIEYKKTSDGKYEFTFTPEKNQKIFEVKFDKNYCDKGKEYTLTISDGKTTLNTKFTIPSSSSIREVFTSTYNIAIDFNTFGVNIQDNNNKINKNINQTTLDLIKENIRKNNNIYILYEINIQVKNNIKKQLSEILRKLIDIINFFGFENCKILFYSEIDYHNGDLPTNLIDTLRNYGANKFYSSNQKQLELVKNAKIETLEEVSGKSYRIYLVTGKGIDHL